MVLGKSQTPQDFFIAKLYTKISKMNEFEDKKKKFFIRLAKETSDVLLMHEKYGLWDKDENGQKWTNVSEHCLLEAARAEVFSDLLRFSDDIKMDLKKTAALHDFFKRREREITLQGGDEWENVKKSEELADAEILKMNLGKEIVELLGAVGSRSFVKADAIIKKDIKYLTDKEIAFLLMHYIDDYTIGDEWVKTAVFNEEGEQKNNLDRRVEKSKIRYSKVKDNPHALVNGEHIFDAELRIGHKIEEIISELIEVKSGIKIDPIGLPEFIDKILLEKIASTGI